MSSTVVNTTTTTTADLQENTNNAQLARGDASPASRGGAIGLASPATGGTGRSGGGGGGDGGDGGGSGNVSDAGGGAGGEGEIVTAANSRTMTHNDTFWQFLTAVLGLMTLVSTSNIVFNISFPRGAGEIERKSRRSLYEVWSLIDLIFSPARRRSPRQEKITSPHSRVRLFIFCSKLCYEFTAS